MPIDEPPQSLENVTPADVFYGRDKEVLQKRNLLKEKTMVLRRQNYLQMAVYNPNRWRKVSTNIYPLCPETFEDVQITDGKIIPLNDYDVVIVSTGESIDGHTLAELSIELALILSIRSVDLIVRPIYDLRKLATTNFNYETQYGEFVFYGPSGVLASIPAIDPNNINLEEVRMLLLRNRIVCLFNGYNKNDKGYLPIHAL